MLSCYRILDLTNEKGFLCGKILADLGADVIKVEPPGGEHGRNTEPFYHDSHYPEQSLFWLAYNTGKRSITLNLESSKGRELFKKLAIKADVIIESFEPDHMENLGLSYSTLKELNPRLILTSISGFGQIGPYRDYKAPDIVGMAMGGFMNVTGDPDRSPVRVGFPQAYLMASTRAAEGSVIALWHRQQTGKGQWVDVSMQECVLSSLTLVIPMWDVGNILFKRMGQMWPTPAVRPLQRLIWPCKDGAVVMVIHPAGATGYVARANRALAEWIESEGMSNDFLRNIDWETYDWTKVAKDFHDRLDEVISRFFATHTKIELYMGAKKRGIVLHMVADFQYVLSNPQLMARDYWIDIEHPDLSTTIRYPGAFIKASTVACRASRRSPLVGEHNSQVYEEEMGLSSQELRLLKKSGII